MRSIAHCIVVVAAFLAAGCATSLGGTLGVCGRTLDGDADGSPPGVEVVRLHEHSPLRDLGVTRGDVIVTLDGEAVATARDLGDRVRSAGFEKAVRIGVRRGDGLREIEVVPAEARRGWRIGVMIPFVGGWDDRTDTVTVGRASLVDIGVGPDHKGLRLLSCIGYWSEPERWDVTLVVLAVGGGYHIAPPARQDAKEGDAASP